MSAKVGKCLESVDVESVLPVQTWQEKRLRFEWLEKPSDKFLANWNYLQAPNQMFVEDIDETGIVVTVRWALMQQPVEKIAEYLNNWLAKCDALDFKKSGIGGRRLQPT